MRQTQSGFSQRFVFRMLAAIFIAVCPGQIEQSRAEDWPQFLGPDRNGISKETGLLDSWGDAGPDELWRIPGGVGMSAVAVKDGLACTMIQTKREQQLLGFDAATGTKKWTAAIAPNYRNQMGNGPRGTPLLTADAAFVFTGEGVLARVNLKDGSLDWKVVTLNRHPGAVMDYGMACSPVLWGTAVIVTVGARQATVVAFDQKTGETLWTAGRAGSAGYSSPAVLQAGGQEQLVVFAGAAAFGVDSAGKELWRYGYVTDYDCNIATPLSIDGSVLISAGENHGTTLLNLKPGGSGFDTSVAWASTGTGSMLRNEWQTSILLDGYLYGFDNVGSAGPVTHLTCVRAKTGERIWREPRFGKGNMIAADGKLFATTMKGELVVMQASPNGFQELGRKKVIGTTRQAPSLANGRLYIRDDAEIVCFDVRRQ
ncbi:MAG: PQQ-binding-like beta-propeller repeat protein [Planctomycetaceae bacterium]